MGVRAICFDAAGTLFTVREPVGVTYARIASAHGIDLDPTCAERGFRHAFSCAPPLAFPGVPPQRVHARERAWWHAVVAETFRAGGAADTPSALFDTVFDELFRHYAGGDAWRCYDDTRAILGTLRAQGYRLAVISNFDCRLSRIADGLGLTPLVDAIISSVQAGAAKPARAIFHQALTVLEVEATEALHVGNDLGRDVEGARAAGLAAVLIDRERTGQTVRPETEPAIANLFDLQQIVAGAGSLSR